MDIKELRKNIDKIDTEIVGLINERYRYVLEIGKLKKKNSEAIYVPERETALIRKLSSINAGPMPEETLRAIYREIMSGALALEHPLRISFLGPDGTFTHQAVISKFGHGVEYHSCGNIADIFKDIETGRADYGCVPVENSTEGVVNHTLDSLMLSPVQVCAELNMRIHQYLMAKCRKEQIKKIYSRMEVFGQCRNYLQQEMNGIEQIAVGSTTQAAQLAAQEKYAAAIASSLASEKYDISILEENIEDFSNNTTRFLFIGMQATEATGDDKTSICFAVKDKVGALYECLKSFRDANITMSMIESRPIKNSNWEYCFFIDILGHQTDVGVQNALEELKQHCGFMKILGSYPRSC